VDATDIPAGVFNCVFGRGAELGPFLTTHAQVDCVSFTGSTQVGKQIQRDAADSIKRVCLELGGKSPFIIGQTSSLQQAVKFGVEDVMMACVRQQKIIALITLPFCFFVLDIMADDLFEPLSTKSNRGLNPLGVPGSDYWQQQVNYRINANLSTATHYLTAQAEVEYHNRSPYKLDFLWFELPQQRFTENSLSQQVLAEPYQLPPHIKQIAGTHELKVSLNGKPLQIDWQDTFFKITLPHSLLPDRAVHLEMKWDLQFIPRNHPSSPRSGYETFDNGGSLLTAAQWFPRAVAFTQTGWSLYPFIKDAEFSLEVGNYQVNVSAPEDYWVLASGELSNAKQVMLPQQYQQWQAADKRTDLHIKPANVSQPKFKQWRFTINNVRDFSFVTGNSLIVKTKKLKLGDRTIRINLAFPDNGRWLWNKYGFASVEHALIELDKLLGAIPFKTLSVINSVGIGMEYPGLKVIGFRGPDADIEGDAPVYSRTEKYDVIAGIIHEVAHAYFPMTVNSDERLEGFLDEGLASYLSFLVEQRWNPNFQSFYGQPFKVGRIMHHPDYLPPVTRADHNPRKLDMHYHIPAVAFTILHKQILKEGQFTQLLSDFIRHWQGKRATFNDFQNFLHSQTGQDLSWFWRTWFYGNYHVDLALDTVTTEVINRLPDNVTALESVSKSITKVKQKLTAAVSLGDSREGLNADLQDSHSDQVDPIDGYGIEKLADFALPQYPPNSVNHAWQKIRIRLRNIGGIPMPVSLQLIFVDGRVLEKVLTTAIWRSNTQISQLELYVKDSAVLHQVRLDPLLQSGDADLSNNVLNALVYPVSLSTPLQ
jgi:hypothetical protein